MATLKFDNVNKIYDNNVQAVFDFNLEIKDKEFVVFVGPSGCGKSTTLRMVAGLEDITYGDLYIDNELVNEVQPKNRNIAMVFQNYALFPHMTVFDNIAFSLRIRKIEMPLYLPNPKVDEIEEQNKLLFKKVHALKRVFRKDPNNLEKLEPIIAGYHEIYENLEKIDKINKPLMGINQNKIKELNQYLSKLESEINRLEKELTKYGDDVETSNVITQSIEQKKTQVNKAKKELEYLSKNEVPLTKLRKLNKKEIEIKVSKTAETLGLTEYLERKPVALSGGQRQRVALGRAIVREPKVFLMDEPLSNLDAKLRVQMRTEIIKIHKQVGATTIYVTHDQTEAMTMADRIVVMSKGYVQQIGTPEEVYDDPSNTFVAGFIGSPSMNFIEGTVSGSKFMLDKKTSIDLTASQAKLFKNMSKDTKIILGVRPEHAYCYKAKDVKLTNFIDAKCKISELLGSETIAYSEISGQKFSIKTNDLHNIKMDDEFKIAFDVNKMYFFNKETGMRIK